MMKLIKLCLWVAATLIIAYFLADFKVGGGNDQTKGRSFLSGKLKL